MTLLQLIPSPPSVIAGGIGSTVDLLACRRDRMRRIRGNEISMIFQDPMTSLNPVLTDRASRSPETAVLHRRLGRPRGASWRWRCCTAANIPEPRRRAGEYPHQFSGGMRQRAMIADRRWCAIPLLIADEPTTALDVTIQAQIIELMRG